ncbi:unnamed protein product [Strongylus vulgaris]|uniref:Uncharacterized protein n=1 Tax=Strongylus vulgaris TaxID=40348 RepID=A0A3P7LWG9_STRVU|nr:unnamed protein product [Strongylus vulgaris]
MTCQFNPADVFFYGPQAMPAELRAGRPQSSEKMQAQNNSGGSGQREERDAPRESGLLSYFLRVPTELLLNTDQSSDYAPYVDADSDCFGDAFSRRVMRAVIGFEDVVMASLRALAQNSSEDGYVIEVETVTF